MPQNSKNKKGFVRVMRVKIVFAGGEAKVMSFSDSANVYDLLQEIKPHQRISVDKRILELNSFDPITPLEALGIRNLDTLHVRSQEAATEKGREFCIKEMPDDNSCLFRAVAFVTRTDGEPERQRQVVHDYILLNRLEWGKAELGEEPEEYVRWITQKNSWGGAIELAIFAQVYECEIACVDVATMRMLRFGEGKYQSRVFVVYSGIHYDAVFEKSENRTLFSVDDEEASQKVMDLVQVLNASHAYTDVSNFSIKCDVCGAALTGEKEAEKHAAEYKHYSFSEQ